jgi:hypothetical protein
MTTYPLCEPQIGFRADQGAQVCFVPNYDLSLYVLRTHCLLHRAYHWNNKLLRPQVNNFVNIRIESQGFNLHGYPERSELLVYAYCAKLAVYQLAYGYNFVKLYAAEK